jgi:glutamyl-Q tRNA(Asp) synthetase
MVAAIGSYLQARSQGGEWLVRIEDIDPPREVPGAADAILRTLERFGLHWDGVVIYQSRRSAAYLDALEQLRSDGLLYFCRCSRNELTALGRYGPIYQGRCRNRGENDGALRVVTHDDEIVFHDLLYGPFRQRLQSEIGDFVVRRADGLFAYQLAVVVDDAAQEITEVVRGSDLLDNTPRQIHLQQLLGYATPRYVHLPIALNAHGQKLSKQSGAAAINSMPAAPLLLQVLEFLGQQPPLDLAGATLAEIWRWAIGHWRLAAIPSSASRVPSGGC